MTWEQDPVVGQRGSWEKDPVVSGDNAERTPYGVLGQGLTAGMAGVAGAPVDAINAALGIAGLGTERPFGGSRFLRENIAKLPTGSGPLTYGDIEQVPQEYRPIARAGEAIGGATPFGAAPFAVKSVQSVPAALRPIVETAQKYPKAFLSAEAGGAVGAGVGAGAAEQVFPGQPLPAVAGEMIGGFLHPVALASKGAMRGISQAKSAIAGLRSAGREAKAAELLQKVLADAGEDPSAIVRALREADIAGVNLTSGLKAESPTLLAFEATLAKKSPSFEGVARNRAEDSIVALRRLVGELEASGDPELLKVAAKARQTYFDGLIQGRIQAAELKAKQSAGVLGGDRQAASVKASELLDDALKDVRATEKALWDAVPKDIEIVPSGIIAAYKDIRAGMIKEEPLPPAFISSFVKRISKVKQPPESKIILPDGVSPNLVEPKPTTIPSKDLLRFRSKALELSREAKAKGDFGAARQYQAMADGALKDMEHIPGNAAEQARDWSRTMNERFRQTFAGDALAVSKTGADRIPSELMLEKGFGGGGSVADVRFRDLESAAGMGKKTMLTEQEQFLRSVAQDVTDPNTGAVNPRMLEKFVRDNQSLLERFPALRKDLANAASAERAFKDVAKAGATASKTIQNQAAFSKVLNNENPADTVKQVLSGNNPMGDYNSLVKLARRGGEGAVEGLKSSTLEYAARGATSSTGDFSFARYKELLTRPTSSKGPSLLQVMGESGTMKPDELGRLRRILGEAEKIERGLASRSRMGDLVGEPDALFDLVVRAVGANIGGASALGQAAGAPIVMAGAGSRIARNFFEKLPNTRVMHVLEEAAKDPKFMAVLLEKPRTPTAAKAIQKQINGFLIQAGIMPREEIEREE